MRCRPFLFSCLIALVSPTSALPDAEGARMKEFVAQIRGQVDVNADGSVAGFHLDSTQDERLDRALAARIRAWRFVPVEIDGKPANVKTYMELTLVLTLDMQGHPVGVNMEHVQFVDPPRQVRAKVDAMALRPPRYPDEIAATGIGAKIYLLLQVAADGKVEDVSTERIGLLLPYRKPLPELLAKRTAAQFSRNAVSAARQWRIPGEYLVVCSKPCVVRVPILYSMVGQLWAVRQDVPVTPGNLASTGVRIVSLGANGEPESQTRLADPGLAGGVL